MTCFFYDCMICLLCSSPTNTINYCISSVPLLRVGQRDVIDFILLLPLDATAPASTTIFELQNLVSILPSLLKSISMLYRHSYLIHILSLLPLLSFLSHSYAQSFNLIMIDRVAWGRRFLTFFCSIFD